MVVNNNAAAVLLILPASACRRRSHYPGELVEIGGPFPDAVDVMALAARSSGEVGSDQQDSAFPTTPTPSASRLRAL